MSEIRITHISIDPSTGQRDLGYDETTVDLDEQTRDVTHKFRRHVPAFSRIVTAERAGEALKRFIDRNFNRKNATMPRFCIPVEPDDDDMVLSDYIDQAELRAQFAKDVWAVYYTREYGEHSHAELAARYAALFPDA